MALMLFIAFLLLKQAPLVTFKSILEKFSAGNNYNQKAKKLQDSPTVKKLFRVWKCHDFEVPGM